MIQIPSPVLDLIEKAAESAYPAECCGLLVGRGTLEDGLILTRAIPSRNLKAADHRDRFEIDPQLRFDVMRELEGSDIRIVGHYHSHPDHPAVPSKTDLAAAWEPELVWLITRVEKGTATETAAHILKDDGTGFRPLALSPAVG